MGGVSGRFELGAMNRSSLKGRAFLGGPLSMLQGKTSVCKTMYSSPVTKEATPAIYGYV